MNPHNIQWHVKEIRECFEALQLKPGGPSDSVEHKALAAVERLESTLKSEIRSWDEDSQAAYFDYVKSLAKDVFDECLEASDKTKDDLENEVQDNGSDKVHEAVDGSAWVIYTRLAMKVLLYSNNDGYGFEQGLLDPSTWKDGIDYSAVAFWAMRTDVEEELQELVEAYEEPETDQVHPNWIPAGTCKYCQSKLHTTESDPDSLRDDDSDESMQTTCPSEHDKHELKEESNEE